VGHNCRSFSYSLRRRDRVQIAIPYQGGRVHMRRRKDRRLGGRGEVDRDEEKHELITVREERWVDCANGSTRATLTHPVD
jgi:hypothetical protein